ncbi:MAG: class I SAM-dependent methyltransferase [Acidobacteriota bacterium]
MQQDKQQEERWNIIQQINGLTVQQLNELVFILKPPNSIIPPPTATPGERSYALLQWAESESGDGIDAVRTALARVINYPAAPEKESKQSATDNSFEPSHTANIVTVEVSRSAVWQDLYTKYPKPPTTSEYRYANLFQIASLTIPYITLIGAWQRDVNEYRRGEVTCITDTITTFQLPEDFQLCHISKSIYEDKCRLINYNCEIVPGNLPNLLTFTFSKINYLDYLKSGEHLDDPLPDDPKRTFRDKYAPSLELREFSRSYLTNISGVGIFLITGDNKIIVSKHSRDVTVYADTWSYSASGTMDWSENVHIFNEVARECYEEIGHKVNEENTYLFEFGIDTKKLYFQFGFFEYTGLSSEEIIREARRARDFHAEMQELIAVPFEIDPIVNLLKNQVFEPAAAVGLLTLCTKEFGREKIEQVIDPGFVQMRTRSEMVAEWNRRALRQNESAVMSARYPSHRCREESQKYVQQVIEFIGSDIDGKDVLEIGAGIGRITEHLVLHASSVTCIDISKKMIERNRQRLAGLARNVNYREMFAQDYQREKSHQIIIASLVLIHNVQENEFRKLVEMMSLYGETIFLFEHTDIGYKVSSYTRPRTKAELLSAFQKYRVERQREYQLFNDNIVFLKLVR